MEGSGLRGARRSLFLCLNGAVSYIFIRQYLCTIALWKYHFLCLQHFYPIIYFLLVTYPQLLAWVSAPALCLLSVSQLCWPLDLLTVSSLRADTLLYPLLGPQGRERCLAPCVLVISGPLINNGCLSGFQHLPVDGNSGTVSIKKPKPNFAKKTGNIVGKYFHIHLNTDGFLGCFHLEFFYTFQVLGSIPSFNYTS